jgi:FkbM family methyltransferase
LKIKKVKFYDIYINVLENDWSGMGFISGKVWEPHIIKFLMDELTPNSNFLDVGSNYGIHSFIASKLCKKVYSFEPQKLIYDLCNQSIKDNDIKNIHLFNIALGNKNTKLNMQKFDYLNQDIHVGDVSLVFDSQIGEEVIVNKLDDVINDKIDFIKIDVQGYEKFVLEGGDKIINEHKPIMIIEIETQQLSKFGYDSASLFNYIKKLDYHIFFLEYHYPSDFVCVHNSKLKEFIEKNKNNIKELTENNGLNNCLNYGINEKITYSEEITHNALTLDKIKPKINNKMELNFTLHKTKNNDRVLMTNGPIQQETLLYEVINGTQFVNIKSEDIELDNNWVIRVDHNGKVYEYFEQIIKEEPKLNELNELNELSEPKFTASEFMELLKPILFDLETKILSMGNPHQETFVNLTKESNKIQVESLDEQKNLNNKDVNILVTSICFVNRKKLGAEIYATFANRLLNDVMNKTPFDYRIITNEPFHFEENKNAWGDRIIITEDNLEHEKLTVGPFNQLLKYKTMLGVDKKYDWILYLDCDAGFTSTLDVDKLNNQIKYWESLSFDFLAPRTNAVLKNELNDHENKKSNFLQSNPGKEFNPWIHGGNLFSAKFIFYNITPTSGPIEWGDPIKWMDAKLPSEHVWLIKNNEKLEKCGRIFKSLNEKFETQSADNLITWDMEAFEVGVSSKLAGYNMGELGNEGEFHILNIGFNFNNWEKVKY